MPLSEMSVILQNYWLSILTIAYTFLAILESIVVCMWYKGEGEKLMNFG